MNNRLSALIMTCILFSASILFTGCGGGGGGAATPLDLQSRIFYHAGEAGNYQIYSMKTDGTGTRQLTTTGINQLPSVTSDGREVVFTSNRTGINQAYRMKYDGSAQIQLTTGDRPATNASISGDGRKVVFVRSVDNYTASNIYIMDIDGSNLTTIPNVTNASWPVLNYDGSKVTYSAWDGVHTSVFVINTDGTNKINIMSAPRTLGEFPKFSPDGSKIVYSAGAGMTVQIVIYDIEEGETTVVTDGTDNNQNPCFNTDGTKIVFARLTLGDENIFSMNLDGTGVTQLTTGGLEVNPICPMGSDI